MTFPLFPEQASWVAEETDAIFWVLTAVCALVLIMVFVPMIYFLFAYRRGKPANRRPAPLPMNTIEVTWTLLPAFIFVGFFVWSARHYVFIERPPDGSMEINVVGKQWMWKLQHPEGNREINELHVPVGRVVKLIMTSQDVIHSFFLPAFRIKQDVLPGRYTTEWFRAARPGVYHLFCSEYCGTDHSRMRGRIIAMAPDEYARWLIRGQPSSTLAQTGEQLFRALGCSGCHMGPSVVRAPPLAALYGKPVPLNSGEMVTADEGYIRDSILFPAKQVTGGYENLMPSFQGRVSEEELLALITYIKSLGAAPSMGVPGLTQ